MEVISAGRMSEQPVRSDSQSIAQPITQRKNLVQSKKRARPGTRRRARQRAVELIFEAEAKDTSYDDLLREYDDHNDADNNHMRSVPEYSRILINHIAENQELIDQTVNAHLQDWKLNRLPAVDRAILRLGVAEMFYALDVPLATVIDESVSIAGQLSTDSSPGFINGILGRIQDEAQKNRSRLCM